jgi:hypothetical protein
MTHLQKFIETLKSTNNPKALVLLAVISAPATAHSATLPPSFPQDRTITQWAEDAASVPSIMDDATERRIEKLQMESQALARDTFVFMEKLRTNRRYSEIYARDIPAPTKLELVRKLLSEDFAAFDLATNSKYGDLAQFNDPEKTSALKSLPGMLHRIEKVSETISGIREILVDFRRSTAEGANRADQGVVFTNDIKIALLKLSAALVAIEQRHEERSSKTTAAEQPDKHQNQGGGFGI